MTRPGLRASLAYGLALTLFVSFAQLVAARLAASSLGLSGIAAEAVPGLFFFSGLLACLASGRASDRLPPGPRRLRGETRLALVLLAATLAALPFLTSTPWFLATMALSGGLLGSRIPPLFLILRQSLPPSAMPIAAAVATALTYTAANALELLRHRPAAASLVLAALALLAARILPGPADGDGEDPAPPTGESRGWESTSPPPAALLTALGAVVAADAFGFSLVMHGAFAPFVFSGPSHLAWNAVVRAAAALAIGGLCTPGRSRLVLAGSALLFATSHGLALAMPPSHAAGFAWSAVNGLGVGAYHVPFLVLLAHGPRPGAAGRFAATVALAGWCPALLGVGAGRLGLLLVPEPWLFALALAGALAAAALAATSVAGSGSPGAEVGDGPALG